MVLIYSQIRGGCSCYERCTEKKTHEVYGGVEVDRSIGRYGVEVQKIGGIRWQKLQS